MTIVWILVLLNANSRMLVGFLISQDLHVAPIVAVQGFPLSELILQS